MKKTTPLMIFASAVFAAACVGYSYNQKPDYIQAAQLRVSSYLTNELGPVECQSTPMSNERWALKCLTNKKGKTFAYTVLPAENAPYDVARSFYLEAANENAKMSAQDGLMQYLQINTGSQKIQS